jgi:type I restriction-modification system DNA methylase subunit
MPSKLNLQELKSHLWQSANIQRGSIDSSDFKNYKTCQIVIVPLNHSLKINMLWFQLVYDIEHLNS